MHTHSCWRRMSTRRSASAPNRRISRLRRRAAAQRHCAKRTGKSQTWLVETGEGRTPRPEEPLN